MALASSIQLTPQAPGVISNATIAGAFMFFLADGTAGTIANGLFKKDSAGVVTPLVTASMVPFTPTGNIAATTVQAAIAEVDTEKVALSETVFTNSTWAMSTVTLALTTTLQDIAGVTVTFTTAVANTVVVVWGIADIQANSVTGSDVAFAYLNVDGTDITTTAIINQQQVPGAQAQRGTSGQTWQVTLPSAGSHTLKLRAAKTANTAGTYLAIANHCTITVLGRF